MAGNPAANGVGQLLRLPGGMWAYCGADPSAPNAGTMTIECGYDPGANGVDERRRVRTRGGVAAVRQSHRQVGSGDAGAGEAGGRGAGLVTLTFVD